MKSLYTYLTERTVAEGGAYGHMQHLFDNGDLTWGEIRKIVEDVFRGHIKVYEKMDGQELSVTIKDGEVYASRNKSTLANPMTLDQLDKFFSDRTPEIHNTFVTGMASIRSALLSMSREEQERFFGNGKNYISLELINPATRNVIDYGNVLMICIHGISKYDDKWKLVNIDKEASLEIIKVLRSHGVEVANEYAIKGSEALRLKELKDNSDVLNRLLADLKKAQDGYSDDTTIENWGADKLTEKFKEYVAGTGLTEKIISEYVNQYSPWTSKKPGMNTIKKSLKSSGLNPVEGWLKELIGDSKKLETTFRGWYDEIIRPLENVVINIGIELLQRVEGFLSVDKDHTSRALHASLYRSIQDIKDKNEPEMLDKLYRQLDKISKYKNHLMQAAEGLVFMYKDQMYKLTGQFGAINQIMGLYRYSR